MRNSRLVPAFMVGVLFVALLTFLVWASSPPNPPKDRELIAAARRGDMAQVTSLLGAGANINAHVEQSLLDRLLKSEPPADLGFTPLQHAVQQEHRAVVEVLLTNKADTNARTSTGNTPLMAAASQGNKELVRLLLAHGADPTVKNIHGNSPVNFATKRNMTPTFEAIVEMLEAKASGKPAQAEATSSSSGAPSNPREGKSL